MPGQRNFMPDHPGEKMPKGVKMWRSRFINGIEVEDEQWPKIEPFDPRKSCVVCDYRGEKDAVNTKGETKWAEGYTNERGNKAWVCIPCSKHVSTYNLFRYLKNGKHNKFN